jgi:serine/threonine-protein kinase
LEVLPKARASARKALDLDQAEVEAHVAFGWINALNDWDWAAAERAFSRAIELDPSHAQAHMLLSHHFNVMGRHREALVLIERARALNPLSAHVLWSVPQAHLHLGAFEQAEAECRAAIDLHPDFWPLHTLLGSIFVWQGRADRALPILREGVELSRRHPHALAVSGAAHGLFGRQEAARQLLTELSELSQRRYFSPAEMAWVHAGLGENELALSSLGKAYTERSPWMTRLRLQGPLLGTLPSDSRFRRLLRQMNFPP